MCYNRYKELTCWKNRQHNGSVITHMKRVPHHTHLVHLANRSIWLKGSKFNNNNNKKNCNN